MFGRVKREVKVTPHGKAFLRRAIYILDEVDAAKREATNARNLLRTFADHSIPRARRFGGCLDSSEAAQANRGNAPTYRSLQSPRPGTAKSSRFGRSNGHQVARQARFWRWLQDDLANPGSDYPNWRANSFNVYKPLLREGYLVIAGRGRGLCKAKMSV